MIEIVSNKIIFKNKTVSNKIHFLKKIVSIKSVFFITPLLYFIGTLQVKVTSLLPLNKVL